MSAGASNANAAAKPSTLAAAVATTIPTDFFLLEVDGRVQMQHYGTKFAGKDTEDHMTSVQAGLTTDADRAFHAVPK